MRGTPLSLCVGLWRLDPRGVPRVSFGEELTQAARSVLHESRRYGQLTEAKYALDRLADQAKRHPQPFDLTLPQCTQLYGAFGGLQVYSPWLFSKLAETWTREQASLTSMQASQVLWGLSHARRKDTGARKPTQSLLLRCFQGDATLGSISLALNAASAWGLLLDCFAAVVPRLLLVLRKIFREYRIAASASATTEGGAFDSDAADHPHALGVFVEVSRAIYSMSERHDGGAAWCARHIPSFSKLCAFAASEAFPAAVCAAHSLCPPSPPRPSGWAPLPTATVVHAVDGVSRLFSAIPRNPCYREFFVPRLSGAAPPQAQGSSRQELRCHWVLGDLLRCLRASPAGLRPSQLHPLLRGLRAVRTDAPWGLRRSEVAPMMEGVLQKLFTHSFAVYLANREVPPGFLIRSLYEIVLSGALGWRSSAANSRGANLPPSDIARHVADLHHPRRGGGGSGSGAAEAAQQPLKPPPSMPEIVSEMNAALLEALLRGWGPRLREGGSEGSPPSRRRISPVPLLHERTTPAPQPPARSPSVAAERRPPAMVAGCRRAAAAAAAAAKRATSAPPDPTLLRIKAMLGGGGTAAAAAAPTPTAEHDPLADAVARVASRGGPPRHTPAAPPGLPGGAASSAAHPDARPAAGGGGGGSGGAPTGQQQQQQQQQPEAAGGGQGGVSPQPPRWGETGGPLGVGLLQEGASPPPLLLDPEGDAGWWGGGGGGWGEEEEDDDDDAGAGPLADSAAPPAFAGDDFAQLAASGVGVGAGGHQNPQEEDPSSTDNDTECPSGLSSVEAAKAVYALLALNQPLLHRTDSSVEKRRLISLCEALCIHHSAGFNGADLWKVVAGFSRIPDRGNGVPHPVVQVVADTFFRASHESSPPTVLQVCSFLMRAPHRTPESERAIHIALERVVAEAKGLPCARLAELLSAMSHCSPGEVGPVKAIVEEIGSRVSELGFLQVMECFATLHRLALPDRRVFTAVWVELTSGGGLTEAMKRDLGIPHIFRLLRAAAWMGSVQSKAGGGGGVSNSTVSVSPLIRRLLLVMVYRIRASGGRGGGRGGAGGGKGGRGPPASLSPQDTRLVLDYIASASLQKDSVHREVLGALTKGPHALDLVGAADSLGGKKAPSPRRYAATALSPPRVPVF